MVKRIVFTGGPSSGKTTVIEKIKSLFTSRGYKVIVIDETATYLINMGIRPFGNDAVSMIDFQELVLTLQLAKEKVVDRATEMLPNQDVLLIYDRGSIDNMAYINEEEFKEVLTRLNNEKSFVSLMNKYDLVINLVGRKDLYTTENNSARSEDSDTALELGKRTLKSWMGHNRLKIVLPKDNMDDKVKEVLNITNELLDNNQVKRQEKYAVDLVKTDLATITTKGKGMHILQTYLESSEDIEKRIRKIEFNGCITYSLSTYQIMNDGSKRVINEKSLTEKEYNNLIEYKEKGSNTISKMRYYFDFEGQYFSLDVFDDSSDIGILEINILEDEEVLIPPFVEVLEKVTNDSNYYNKNIAFNCGKELIKK